jgi:hypothetical protein
MVLEQPIKYKVCKGVGYTQNEETKILNLLRDVRASVTLLRPDMAKQRLDIILEAVEKGELILQKSVDSKKSWVELNYNIDLSDAQQIISNYRRNSEGGCQSCISLRSYTPFPGDYFKYCKEVENEAFAIDNWNNNTSESPTIRKFYDIGCENRKPIISKRLEELLQGQD